MRIKALALAGMAFGLAWASSAPASAGTVTIPPPNCGVLASNNCLYFSDFAVFSLALLSYQNTGGGVQTNGPYDVSTNGTALQNALVIGTGVGGAGSVNSDFVGGTNNAPINGDNAYDTPNHQNGVSNFLPGSGNEGAQGSGVPASVQSPNTWDINISSLLAYLGAGGNPIFFFNLNQTNSLSTSVGGLLQEDALGWMEVTLTNSVTHATEHLFLDGNNCSPVPTPGPTGKCLSSPFAQQVMPQTADPSFAILPNSTDQWAWIHGEICATAQGGFIHGGPCAGTDPSDAVTLHQNLGADSAAFALESLKLNTDIRSGAYDVMSVDFRMAGLTNGYEQLLIYSSTSIPQLIPEPLTLTLFGTGLAGLAWMGGRRKKKAA